MNIHCWFPLGLTGLISLLSKGLSRVSSNTIVQKASVFWHSAFLMVQLSHPYMTTGKIIAMTWQTFVGKVTSLFFDMLSRLVIAFLPRSRHLLISWLQSPSTVILEPKKIKSVTAWTHPQPETKRSLLIVGFRRVFSKKFAFTDLLMVWTKYCGIREKTAFWQVTKLIRGRGRVYGEIKFK